MVRIFCFKCGSYDMKEGRSHIGEDGVVVGAGFHCQSCGMVYGGEFLFGLNKYNEIIIEKVRLLVPPQVYEKSPYKFRLPIEEQERLVRKKI